MTVGFTTSKMRRTGSSRESNFSAGMILSVALAFLWFTAVVSASNQPVQQQQGVRQQGNGNGRPQGARRLTQPQPDAFDAQFERIFAATEEKAGKDGSFWDQIKRNFVEDNSLEEAGHERIKRDTEERQPSLIKGLWLDKIFEASTVAAKAFTKVLNHQYPINRLIYRADKSMDIFLNRIPPLLDRAGPLLDMTPAFQRALNMLNELTYTVRPLRPMIPRLEKILGQVERIDLVTLAARADSLLIRVNKLPMERMVETFFNLNAEVKSAVDIARQFQRTAPTLITLFQSSRQQGSSCPSCPSDQLVEKTTTAKPEKIVSSDNATGSVTVPPGLVNIDSRILSRFEPHVIQNLNPAVFRRLTPQLIMAINPSYLNSLSPTVLKNINPRVIAEVDPKFLQQVPADILNALPADIIRDITPEIVNNFEPDLLESVDPELIKSLDSETIRNLLFPSDDSNAATNNSNRRNFVVEPSVPAHVIKAFKGRKSSRPISSTS